MHRYAAAGLAPAAVPYPLRHPVNVLHLGLGCPLLVYRTVTSDERKSARYER